MVFLFPDTDFLVDVLGYAACFNKTIDVYGSSVIDV